MDKKIITSGFCKTKAEVKIKGSFLNLGYNKYS